MPVLAHDLETRSALDLAAVGVSIYARHPTTDVWCVAYSVDGAEPQLWTPGQQVPPEFITAANDPTWVTVAFNDAFEWLITEHVLAPRYGWPRIPLEHRRCAQAAALARALPASQDLVAEALGIELRKDKDSVRHMRLMAQPRKPRITEPPGLYWHDDKASRERHYTYCRLDVRQLNAIVAMIGFIPPAEQTVWQLNATINMRGIHIDRELLTAAVDLTTQITGALDAEITAATGGIITSTGQDKRILQWCAERGCKPDNTQKATIAALLARPDLPTDVRRVLELRQLGAHAAPAKHSTMLNWLEPDDRVRGAFKYHGSATGRFVSHGPQLHNLRRPGADLDPVTIGVIRSGDYAALRKHCPKPLATIGEASRALVTAAPGHRLYIADFSGIESRGAAWICNEARKLEAWRAFDASGSPDDDPYYRFGLKVLGLPPERARAIGKVSDLAFGYQGGVRAYMVREDKTPPRLIKTYQEKWKDAHKAIARFWKHAIKQAIAAHQAHNTGQAFECERTSFISGSNSLFAQLPSGRRIAYPDVILFTDPRYGDQSFTFMENSHGKWWRYGQGKRGVHGGVLLENVTQAVCRDVFVAALLRLEAASYRPVLHLHDEIVCEVPIGHGSLEEFTALMTAAPDWAEGFPIAAKARIAERFIELKPGDGKPEDPEPEPIENDDEILEDDDDGEGGAEDWVPGWMPPPPPAWEPPPLLAAAAERSAPPPPPPQDPEPLEDPDPQGNGSAGWTNGRGRRIDPDDRYAAGEQDTGSTTAAYIYRTADNALYMKVKRTTDKQFPTFRWECEHRRWERGRPHPLLPYRLPELLAAAADAPVYICEGEKDAENVAALGLIATCNPGGASEPGQKSKWPPELNNWFKGKQIVYVLEDNDPAGRWHASQIVRALRPIVPEVVLLAIPGLPEKGDVSDWLALGGTTQLLLSYARQAREQEAKRQHEFPELHWIGEEDVLDSRPWLLPGIIPEVGSGLISGQWGLLKSFAALDLCGAVVAGSVFLGKQIQRQGGALYIAAEGASEMKIRAQALLQEKYPAFNGKPPMVWTEDCPRLLNRDAAFDKIVAWAEHAHAHMLEKFGVPLVLIIVDTLGRAARYAKTGDENDPALAQQIMQLFDDIARRTHTMVFGLDHMGKDPSTGTRGGSPKEDYPDVVVGLLGNKTLEGVLSNSRLAIRKVRGGAAGQEFPFTGRVVELGQDSHGNTVDTLVIDWETTEPSKPAKSTSAEGKWQRSLLRRALMTVGAKGKPIRPDPSLPEVHAIPEELVREEFIAISPADGDTPKAKRTNRRMAYLRALQKAIEQHWIGKREVEGVDYVWMLDPAVAVE